MRGGREWLGNAWCTKPLRSDVAARVCVCVHAVGLLGNVYMCNACTHTHIHVHIREGVRVADSGYISYLRVSSPQGSRDKLRGCSVCTNVQSCVRAFTRVS